MKAPDLHIVLHQPVIPQNTGSIARLCAGTNCTLHLIHPLGFKIDDAAVKRAGLDYWDNVKLQEHDNWNEFLNNCKPANLFFFSKFAKNIYTEVQYPSPSYLVFGSETTGLPKKLWDEYQETFIRIPMRTHLVRSHNIAQSAAVALYEALRQSDFQDLIVTPPERQD